MPPTAVANGTELRRQLLIPPLLRREKPWPSPSLSPGVPSGYIARWGDLFFGASAATPGRQRNSVVDGSWSAGLGLGDPTRIVALELSGGCGSVRNFCANGSFDVKIGRSIINTSTSRLGLAFAWQNAAQWGNEGRQDNTFYGAFSYAVPLRKSTSGFGQTLQFNLGGGNSRYAPFTPENSQTRLGIFGSAGIELAPNLGVSAGWSGRGVNGQISYSPFRHLPITMNLLGVDLFNQTPSGLVGVLSLSWGANFRTASFD